MGSYIYLFPHRVIVVTRGSIYSYNLLLSCCLIQIYILYLNSISMSITIHGIGVYSKDPLYKYCIIWLALFI